MRPRRRTGWVAVLAVLHLAVAAGPALAHGVGAAGPPNWVSRVTDDAPGDGLAWSVVGVDAALRLVNTSDAEVLVQGYGGEPYLRIGPDGVYENRRARTTWLNLDRLADLTAVAVPADVGPDQPPDWVRVHDDPAWTWLDHRIHWMNPRRLPDAVAADPASVQVVRTWQVPASRDGTSVGPAGELVWHPTPVAGAGPWALPLVAAVLLGAVVARWGRRPATLRAVAAGLVVLAIAGGWHEVGSLVPLGPVVGSGPVTSALVRSGALALAATVVLVASRRQDRRAGALLVAVAVALSVVVGWRELAALRAPVPRGPWPAPAIRALVAVAIAAPVPAVMAAWWDRAGVPATRRGRAVSL